MARSLKGKDKQKKKKERNNIHKEKRRIPFRVKGGCKRVGVGVMREVVVLVVITVGLGSGEGGGRRRRRGGGGNGIGVWLSGKLLVDFIIQGLVVVFTWLGTLPLELRVLEFVLEPVFVDSECFLAVFCQHLEHCWAGE